MNSPTTITPPVITIDELYARFKSLAKDELILDVRTPEEFAEGHIPGARNISHEGVAAFAKELARYRKVYVQCRSGHRVQVACLDLGNAGLTNLVALVDGGMPDWIAKGYPVAKGSQG